MKVPSDYRNIAKVSLSSKFLLMDEKSTAFVLCYSFKLCWHETRKLCTLY